MEIPPVKNIGDNEISNEEASGVRAKINDKTTISCLRCDYQSDKLHNFRKHYRSMHLPCKSTKSLFCCDTSFLTKWDYVQHSMICHGKPKSGHNGMKRSRTTSKATVTPEPLRGHGSDYFCSDCDFTSASKYNTLRHMKICANKKSSCNVDSNKLDDNPNVPDSTTSPGSDLSSNNPILHQMLQAPPLFQEGHALIESFMNCTKPVSSLEVSSSSMSGVDSRKTGLVSSCATLTSAKGHREPPNSCSNVYKWPFVVGPSPYSIPCHYPQPYSALYQQQLFSAQSQPWINVHNQYPFIRNSNNAQAIKSFQGQSNATPTTPNFHMEFSNPTFRVKDSDNEDDIDVVS